MYFRRTLIAVVVFSAAIAPLAAQEDLPSLLKAGAELEQQHELVKATEIYKKATTAYPSQAIGFLRLGHLYEREGSFSLAAPNYRKALELSPGDEQLRVLTEATERAAAERAAGVVKAETFRTLAAATRSVKTETVKAQILTAAKDASAPANAEPETIPVNVNFPRGKYLVGDLDQTARRQLDEVANYLTSAEWRDRRPLIIEGHTCSCGSDAANEVLGRKRGEAVLEYLISKNALKAGDGSVISMGKSDPVVKPAQENLSAEACSRDEAHNQNRRVIIREARGSATPVVSFWYQSHGSEDLRQLTDGSTIYRQDEVRIKVQTPTPMFAYVVHHGPDNAWEVLYSSRAAKGATASGRLPAGTDGVWIPGENAGFPVRGKPGDEEAQVYLNPTPIPEFEGQLKKAVPPPQVVAGLDGKVVDTPAKGSKPGPAPPPPLAAAAPTAPVVAIDTDVRSLVSSLAVPAARKLAALPQGTRPVATVKFKSHE